MDDIDVSEDEEDDYVIPFEPVEQRERKIIFQKKLHQLVWNHIESKQNKQKYHPLGKRNEANIDKEVNKRASKERTEEARFASYFKRRIKFLNNRNCYSLMTAENYYDKLHLVFELVDSLIKNGFVSDREDASIKSNYICSFLMDSFNILLLKDIKVFNRVFK